MLRQMILPVLVVSAIGPWTAWSPAQDAEEASSKFRVGVYDSRAVAVAFAASDFNPVGERMKEHREAKAAGDDRRVKELESWGERYQRQLHFQGFGRVPVTDLLAKVEDQLARVAAEQGVDVIAMQCDYSSARVVVVDITDALVELFDPSPRTLRTVEELKKVKPLPLVELADMKADH